MKTKWAVLLCKWADKSVEPKNAAFYQKLFSTTAPGAMNLGDFFRDMSHGEIDIGSSQVFGWLEFKKLRSDDKDPAIIETARNTAKAEGIKLDEFFDVVVVMNAPMAGVPDFAYATVGHGGVACSSNADAVSVLGQEMLHVHGLHHSRTIVAPLTDYMDPWDVMSVNAAHMGNHPTYGRIGPGLNAWNMRGLGWLDESRVFNPPSASVGPKKMMMNGDLWEQHVSLSLDTNIELRPLHRRDLPGCLALALDSYLVEFRVPEVWDAGIPRACVLVHRFEDKLDKHSYLMTSYTANLDLVKGDVFSVGAPLKAGDFGTFIEVKVVKIDEAGRNATVHVRYQHEGISYSPVLTKPASFPPAFKFSDLRYPDPWSPLSTLEIIQKQLEVYASADQITDISLANTVRRSALEEISGHVSRAMDAAKPKIAIPAPLKQAKISRKRRDRK